MYTVVVESPSKAKTINKYLGKDYTVLASFGHVRDLPSKDGSVEPDSNFAMHYEVDADSKKHLAAIAKAVRTSEKLFLATDPDREGEAISWHVLEALKASKALKKDVVVKRVVFEEITKSAVLEAFKNPRDIDMDLVNAQQARRALDYLVGFTLSPVLWRKLPGSKSAGRVQSVALRLICERDSEIEKFESREYWDIKADLLNSTKVELATRLIQYNGEKLEKFSITEESKAKKIAADVESKSYKVETLEPKQAKRHPAPPFTTSTLQQEASRKLGFGAKRTMQLAQKLYEGMEIGGETTGLITYMRTDSVSVSTQAVTAARSFIEKEHGKAYVPDAPRAYKSKAKNAQEAHEAIRPTEISRTPDSLRRILDEDMLRLYELVWKRMVASQMESAIFDQLVVDITSTDGKATLRANGSVVKFDGFLRLYAEGKDDEEDEEQKRLPALKLGEALDVKEVRPEQHFTEPPPRYTEATLVKKLEELGIGRPSTYAAIISVLQERKYVTLDKKRFIAEPLGRIVNAFLVSFFEKYVEYGFTADLEDQLDDVSAGERDWKKVLREFWNDFIAKIEDSKKLSISEVLEAIDGLLASYLFGKRADGSDPRKCPSCAKGQLGVKLGRYGSYIGCSAYPDCTYKSQIGDAAASEEEAAEAAQYPKNLGNHPEVGEAIWLKKGPYGFYVQIGEDKKPKRASLMKDMTPESVDLSVALSLLSMPRDIGNHPDSGKPIVVGIGRFGPYLLHDGKYTSLPPAENPLEIGINRAVDVMANAKAPKAKAEPLAKLGKHPEDGKEVVIMDGKYGAYIKWNKINATLPKDKTPTEFTMAEAVELLAAKSGSPKKKPFKKRA